MLPSMQCGSSNPGGREKQIGKALPRNIRWPMKKCLHSTGHESSHLPTCYLSFFGEGIYFETESTSIPRFLQCIICQSSQFPFYPFHQLPTKSTTVGTVGDLGPFAHKVKHPRISRDLAFTPMIRWLTWTKVVMW